MACQAGTRKQDETMAFTLPELPYAQDALEPHIDAKTMGIHHGKHHNGYTTKLNAAIEGSELEGKSIEEILGGVSAHGPGVRNNGGGFYNHSLFWGDYVTRWWRSTFGRLGSSH